MKVKMLPMKPGMTAAEAWSSFVAAMDIPHDPRLQAVFLAGFSAGMGYLAKRQDDARHSASDEIARLVSASEQEAAHRA